MDLFTQMFVGSAFSQSASSNKKDIKYAFIIGAVAGLLPDSDSFLRFVIEHPLARIIYHRHFTHSLIFIPVGALIAALMCYPFFKKKLSFKNIYLFSFIGYATHGILDACTSYGTLLLWPFSYERFTFNIISIVDLLFTIPVLILIIQSIRKKNVNLARVSVIWIIAILSFGFVQKISVTKIAKKQGISRGHSPENVFVMPNKFNQLSWKTIYEFNGYFYSDNVELLFPFWKKVTKGMTVKKFTLKDLPKTITLETTQYNDTKIFLWFTKGYAYKEGAFIGDFRYLKDVNSLKSLWGIELIPNAPNKHIRYSNHLRQTTKERVKKLWKGPKKI